MKKISSFTSNFKYIQSLWYLSLKIIPFFLVVASVNYIADPARVFRGRSFEKLVGNALANGYVVLDAQNLDERHVQQYYVDKISHRNDIVVLGSSRSMQLGIRSLNNSIKDCQFHNNSVSSATLADYLAIYNFYRISNKLPKIVIIGVDPWILNRNSGESGYLTVMDSYKEMLNYLDGIASVNYNFLSLRLRDNIFRTLQLVSPSYFQASVAKLYSGRLTNEHEPRISLSQIDTDDAAILPDGTHIYEAKARNKPLQEIRLETLARSNSKEVYYNISNFTEIDQNSLSLFKKFIEKILDENIEVVFYLPPYHPIIAKVIQNRTDLQMIAQAERIFVDFAGIKGIPVYGSYYKNTDSLTENDFFDWMHPRPSGVSKVFSEAKFNCN